MDLHELKERLGPNLSRWLVAAVLLPPIVYSAVTDHYLPFFLVMLAIGALTWWEYSRNLLGHDRIGLFGLGAAGWALTAAGAYFYGPSGQSIGLVGAISMGAVYAMWALERESGPVLLNLLGRFALGHIYLSFLLSFFLLLKKLDAGGLWLVYVLVVTIAADTAAFYVGSKVKGPKLCPKISPNKTVSGLFGGAAGAMAVSAACAWFLSASLPLLAVLGLFLGFWGAVGDLFESALKRAIGIKDSSGLLLGHGGFWDRIDSLLFNIAPVYVVAEMVMNSL
ncbi:MAG: phosphatidate cytidylyltransferase [Candidatus Adiutrix sp.]|jgi:phosphatidate cytidylyltransferase|nr:phosphatidate cytidylyltransferase [Candidatus Adiutrix sp.]